VAYEFEDQLLTKIVTLPGDGIGPEIVAQAQACLALLSDARGLGLVFEEHDFGGVAIDRHGKPLPDATLEACQGADAILLGAVGGPRWDASVERPEAGLLQLRKTLGLFANLRPARIMAGLEGLSPLRADIAAGADVLVVRELTGGLYFGEKVLDDDKASDLCTYSREEIERVAHVAFKAAQGRNGRVTSVDKANVLATSKLWRKVVTEVAAHYPDVVLDHSLVDSTAMHIVTKPTAFDVILTENLFGDILSDELSVIGGSIGLLGSSSIGTGRAAVFEPIHGSAPDIAGKDFANPAGTIASAAMLLDYIGAAAEARLLERALEQAIFAGKLTRDLGGDLGCAAFGEAVRDELRALLAAAPAEASA
jgi:3-isopropylmalate dehydrogenase